MTAKFLKKVVLSDLPGINFLIMCILITKPRGAQFPPLEAICNSAENNPDGFSLAYNIGNELITYKTMSVRRFISKYMSLSSILDAGDTGMIIHARIATHGSITLKNCHCWKTFEGHFDEMAFAHNGILSIHTRNGMTDSETFLRDYFEPAYLSGGWEEAEKVIIKNIGFSKFAFIDKDGDICQFGNFLNEDGCSYSNTSYLSRRSRYGRL